MTTARTARRVPAALRACALALLLAAGARPGGAQPPQRVEVNHASEAQLDGVRGLGPATTRRILAERARQPFAGWEDLIARVKGIGPAAAARLSHEGLTVTGEPYRPAAPARAPGSD